MDLLIMVYDELWVGLLGKDRVLPAQVKKDTNGEKK